MSAAILPRTLFPQPMRPVLVAAVMLIPFATWLHSLGDPVAYLRSALPPGQSLYLLSKLLGLYALLVITLQLLLGLRIASVPRDEAAERFEHHRLLGLTCLLLVLAHSGTFIAAVSVRTNHFARDYVIPTMSHGFYRTLVSVGLVAFAVLVVAALSRTFRHRWPRVSNGLHKLTLVAYSLIFVHSLAIGSESRMGVMPALYVVLGALVLFGLFRRLRSTRTPGSRPPTSLPSPLHALR